MIAGTEEEGSIMEIGSMDEGLKAIQEEDIMLDDKDFEIREGDYNDLFEQKCDIVESVLESMELRLYEENGVPYSKRGYYVLEKPMVISVDNDKECTAKITLLLFNTAWEDENFDLHHFYDVVSKRCFVSLQIVDEKFIEYRTIVPSVPMEIFRDTIKAAIEECMGTARYFGRLRQSYRELFC